MNPISESDENRSTHGPSVATRDQNVAPDRSGELLDSHALSSSITCAKKKPEEEKDEEEEDEEEEKEEDEEQEEDEEEEDEEQEEKVKKERNQSINRKTS